MKTETRVFTFDVHSDQTLFCTGGPGGREKRYDEIVNLGWRPVTWRFDSGKGRYEVVMQREARSEGELGAGYAPSA